MTGLFMISVLVFLVISSTMVSLLQRNNLPNVGEGIFFETFIFTFVYIWGVLNPSDMDER